MKKLVLSALSVAVLGLGFASIAEENATPPGKEVKQEATAISGKHGHKHKHHKHHKHHKEGQKGGQTEGQK
jgi:Ni/Co efflux regulator RcnB